MERCECYGPTWKKVSLQTKYFETTELFNIRILLTRIRITFERTLNDEVIWIKHTQRKTITATTRIAYHPNSTEKTHTKSQERMEQRNNDNNI